MLVLTRRMAAASLVMLIGALGAGSASAQSKGIELNGFAGMYAPKDTKGLQEGDRDAKRKASIAFGGRLTYWTGTALGVEFTGGFSPARVSVVSARGTFPRSTQLAFGSAKLLYNLTGKSKTLGVALGGGLAGLHAGKTVVDPAKSTTNMGGVGGLAIRLHLGENVALRGDGEVYLYSGDYGFGKKFTQDLMLSGGLSISF
jgi:hypothetical protein